MHIYSGKFTHIDGYATNELWTITFPNEIKAGDDAILMCQWTKMYAGEEKMNEVGRGKITKLETVTNGPTQIEIFKGDRYYWCVQRSPYHPGIYVG